MERMTGIGVGPPPKPFMAENSKPNLPVVETTKTKPARTTTKRSSAKATKKAK